MFDIAPSELLVVALVALVFIGPKDLPRVMRTVGQWAGKGRAMARHFRSAMDEMVREAELAEMEKKWKEENERIMREHAHLIEPGKYAPEAEQARLASEALPAPTPPEPAPPVPTEQPAPLAHETAVSPVADTPSASRG
jgi:sec-independent protein translocase protein TatB